jgi:hypothetical protein
MTKNGSGSLRVSPSAVTWCSSIASSSADWVFGVARFTSSARMTCAKIGRDGSESRSFRARTPRRRGCRRQHVARELDALELQAERSGEHVRERRLADTGHVFDEQVTAREQARKRQPHLRFLAEDDAPAASITARQATARRVATGALGAFRDSTDRVSTLFAWG